MTGVRYDAVVIGAGHNGLVTAASLAEAASISEAWTAVAFMTIMVVTNRRGVRGGPEKSTVHYR